MINWGVRIAIWNESHIEGAWYQIVIVNFYVLLRSLHAMCKLQVLLSSVVYCMHTHLHKPTKLFGDCEFIKVLQALDLDWTEDNGMNKTWTNHAL